MAVTLQLTDGTDTVDFNDGTVLSLGNTQQINIGAGTVTEFITCGWETNAIATRASKLQLITKLLTKGVRHYRERRVDDAVWLSFKPEGGGGDPMYAKVQGGSVQELRNDIVGRNRTGQLMVEILREGYWRELIPSSGGASADAESSGTLYNKSDADGDNWLTANAQGDAPSQLYISVNPGSVTQKVLVASKVGPTTTFLDKFNPYFNPADASTITYTLGNTAAPGDTAAILNSGSGHSAQTVSWTIAAGDTEAYRGRYAAYIWVYQSSGTDATVQFYVDIPGGFVSEEKSIATTTNDAVLYMGTFNFPGVTVDPFVTQAEGIDISVDMALNGTGNMQMHAVWLVPLDYPPFEISLTGTEETTDIFVIDGTTQQAYIVDASSSNQNFPGAIETQGVYPLAQVNGNTRLYFFMQDGNGAHVFNDSYTVSVREGARYLTFKG